MQYLIPNLFELFESIEECRIKERPLSTLILVYSGIDILASLERQSGEGTKSAFVRWAENYLLNNTSLLCTGLELYGARCGVLHTFTAESDLSRSGSIRPIIYATGDATAVDLQTTVVRLNRNEVAIHLDDLVEAFRLGTASYLEDLAQDSQRARAVQTAAGIWFTSIPKDDVVQFLSEE